VGGVASRRTLRPHVRDIQYLAGGMPEK
jgi:hypothetical protein